MSSPKLPNYVRLHRKRLGFSQQEVAFLLGCCDGSKTSRYEHFSRIPTLHTALALAVILRVSVYELFSGEYQKVENAVCRQAQLLERRLVMEHADEQTTRKLTLLKMLKSADYQSWQQTN